MEPVELSSNLAPDMSQSGLKVSTQMLLAGMVDSYDSNFGFGHMSYSIYDTAWLSMIRRGTNSHTEWLFNQSFRYLLDAQEDHGGWQAEPTQIDGILNSLAAILALCKRLEHQATFRDVLLEERKARGVIYLRDALRGWNVETTQHVSFEILVPALLDQIEPYGALLDFPAKPALLRLKDRKLARFKPELLYGNHQTPVLHSLEAFIGVIDFNKVAHHKVFGSMLASPSSTAVYLMNASPWDSEAEAYLRHVVAHGAGKGEGAVPPAFPTTVFETSWALSTLLQGGFTTTDLGEEHCAFLADILGAGFATQASLNGFARGLIPDADDTAKTIIVLRLLGRPAPPEDMIKRYEAAEHFQTYLHERNASFSANCNILQALLHLDKPNEFIGQIAKATKFICDTWWDCEGHIEDKWNLSSHYSTMLMAQSLMHLLTSWDQGSLPDFDRQLLTNKVFVALFQALVRTLHAQNEDGSWGAESGEESAYATLTISAIRELPAAELLRGTLNQALERGRAFVARHRQSESKLDALWIEKVSYSSKVLYESYTIAALFTGKSETTFSSAICDLMQIPSSKVRKFLSFYKGLPLFAQQPEWKLQASLVESYLFLPKL